jgi:hypothetical protein
MAVGAPVVDTGPPPDGTQDPVGLRVLRLWGHPLVRAHLIREKTSIFLYPLVSSTLLLATIYGIGVLVAWHDGVLGLFLGNPLVPALLVVTGWSAIWISWAGSVYQKWEFGTDSPTAITDSLPMLHLSDDLKQRLKAHWNRLCSLRVAGRYALVGIALVVGYMYLSIYGPTSWATAAPASIRTLYSFPNQSYWMFVYLAAVGAVLADVGSFGLYFTVEHLRFVTEFVSSEEAVVQSGNSTTVKQLYLAQKPLQELAYASFLSSMAWFGAITVLVAVFVVELNVFTFLGLAFFMVFGLYVFLRPQWEFHKLIRSAKAAALGRLEGSMGTDWYDKATNAPKREHVPTLVLAQNVAAISDWHVDVRLVIAQIIGALFPLIAAIFSGPLGVHLG